MIRLRANVKQRMFPCPSRRRSRSAACALGVAVALGLGACAHHEEISPAPEPRLTSQPHGWNDAAVIEALRNLRAELTAAPGTLSSTESLAAALSYNPELDIQRAQANVARAELQRAQERRNPVFNFSPEHLISAAADGISPWVIALSLVWPVRTAGKRGHEIEQALAMSDAALLDGANAIWSLRVSVRSAVCQLELAAERNALSVEERSLRADLAMRLASQSDAGIASRYDATRARIDSERAVQSARESEVALEQARFDLAEMTGLPRPALDQRQIGATCNASPSLPADALPELEARAIAGRLDLRARLAEFRAADAALRGELAKRYPDVDIGPGYMYDQGDRKITLSVSAELPIYSHNDAGIARANAERARRAAEVDKLQWSIRSDVDRAHAVLLLRMSQLDDAQRVTGEYQSLVERDRSRFASGEIDQPAVIATQLGALGARQDALAARQALLQAIGDLEAALQVPLSPPYFDGDAARQLIAPADTGGTKQK